MSNKYFGKSYKEIDKKKSLYTKLNFISVAFAFVVLSLPLAFSFLSYLSKTAEAVNNELQQEYVEKGEVQGASTEIIVQAEEEFVDYLEVGQTISMEERSRVIKQISSEIQSGDRREIVLRAYLETMLCANGSKPPLAEHTKELVESADKYGLDWRYTTAISGVETWFGCAGKADDYKNAWGYGGGPATRFHYSSWAEGIDAFSKGFASGYGKQNINFHKIASYYTTGMKGTNDRWANGVMSYLHGIDEMDKELK